MEERDSEARVLFKRFLVERWFGGPDFESWVRGYREHETELRLLQDEWLSRLRDPDSPGFDPVAEHEVRRAGSFQEGELISGFRLKRRIGSGACGEVWEAEEVGLGGRAVALKLLRPDLVADPRAFERFLNEPIALARSHHPGVVAVYSVGRDRGQPWIAEELIEGGNSFATLIGEQTKFGEPTSAYYRRVSGLVLQVADALAAAHEAGIIHRDIKPQNLLIAPGDRAKVVDFGLAHLEGENISHTGDVIGTLCYMSPAQVRGENKQLDERADVFSLGATFYELLTLQRAFRGRTLHEITNQILFEDPPSARSIRSRVPRHLELLCAKALEKRAADRIPNMRVFATELGRFLEGEATQLKRPSLSSRTARWIRRHPTMSVSAGLSIAALGGLLWLDSVRGAQTRRARLGDLHANAQYAIAVGDMDEAERRIAEADGLGDPDPIGHLLLATGFARLGRSPELERELALAKEYGFDEAAAPSDDALEHAARALSLMSRRDFALYPEAEQHIARALELDDHQYGLELSRFFMRTAVGDREGALAALQAFAAHVPNGEPEYQTLEALRLETLGDLRGALDVLERLRDRPGMTEERLVQLRWHRNAGRLCANLGDLEGAEAYLKRAVADAPRDCWSWDGLAVVALKRLRAGDESQAVRAQAIEYAQRAEDCSPSLTNPSIVLAYVAEVQLAQLPASEDIHASSPWKAARAALDRLHQLEPRGSVQGRRLEAHLLFLDARAPFEAGDHAQAAALYEQALAFDPDDLSVISHQGQCLWYLDRHAEGLALFQHGLALWDDPAQDVERNATTLCVMLAWSLGHAGKLADAAAFRRARERFQATLEMELDFDKGMLLSAAEFLATAPEELKDCEFAWELVEEHELRSAFPGNLEARRALDAIASACP